MRKGDEAELYNRSAMCCTLRVDVAISALRAELASWVARAQAGEEVVVTDRGIPVARLTGIDTAPLLEQLFRSGVLSRPQRSERPVARSCRAATRGTNAARSWAIKMRQTSSQFHTAALKRRKAG